MTTVDTKPPMARVLGWTALLVLPAIALPLFTSRMSAVTQQLPWLLWIAAPVTALAALGVIWRWPGKGWRYVLLVQSLSGLVVGMLVAGTADPAVVLVVATLVGAMALVGVLGAAAWLAQAGSRALAAAVAGGAVVTHEVKYFVGLGDLGSPMRDFAPLFAVAGVALLCAGALLVLDARFGSEHARLSERVVIAAAAVSLSPLAFLVADWLLPTPADAFAAQTARFQAIGVVALVVAVVIVALAAWALGARALGALSLGALVAGAGTVAGYIMFMSMNSDGGLGSAAWEFILTGLAVGVVLALSPIRGYLGAGAALVGAVAFYLAAAETAADPVWHQFAVAAALAAVVAGAAAVCDGPSAVAVGVIGVMLGDALDTVDWIWNGRSVNPMFNDGPIDWMPVAWMALAAIGLAVFTFQGRKAQRLQTYQTSGLPTVP